jgi:hypothetical protein
MSDIDNKTNEIQVEKSVDSDVKQNEENNDFEQLSTLLDPFSLVENSDLYVVTVNDYPRLYVKDEKSASDKMWSTIRLLSGREFLNGWRTNYVQISDTELHLFGSYKFFLISYDQILQRVSYSRVKECV